MTLSVAVARSQPRHTQASERALAVRDALRKRSGSRPAAAVQVTVGEIADELGVTPRTVQRALRELEGLELLQVQVGRTGRGWPRSYRLACAHP